MKINGEKKRIEKTKEGKEELTTKGMFQNAFLGGV